MRSAGLAAFPTVARHAHGRVRVESVGAVEIMKVNVWGLPPNTLAWVDEPWDLRWPGISATVVKGLDKAGDFAVGTSVGRKAAAVDTLDFDRTEKGFDGRVIVTTPPTTHAGHDAMRLGQLPVGGARILDAVQTFLAAELVGTAWSGGDPGTGEQAF